STIEIGYDGKLEPRRQHLQNLLHVWVKLPHTSLRKMRISSFEESIAGERIDLCRNPIQQTLDQLAPPTLVVVKPRLPRRRTKRHFLPDLDEGEIHRGGFQREALALRHQRIVPADTFR